MTVQDLLDFIKDNNVSSDLIVKSSEQSEICDVIVDTTSRYLVISPVENA